MRRFQPTPEDVAPDCVESGLNLAEFGQTWSNFGCPLGLLLGSVSRLGLWSRRWSEPRTLTHPQTLEMWSTARAPRRAEGSAVCATYDGCGRPRPQDPLGPTRRVVPSSPPEQSPTQWIHSGAVCPCGRSRTWLRHGKHPGGLWPAWAECWPNWAKLWTKIGQVLQHVTQTQNVAEIIQNMINTGRVQSNFDRTRPEFV